MQLIDSLSSIIEHFGYTSYWLIFFIFFAEALVFVGLLVPGMLIAIFLGALAAQGVLDLGDTIFFICLGFFLGDALSYYLGTKGTGFFRQENRILSHVNLESGREFFARHGSKSLILARFIGPLRPLIPFVAGLSKMEKKRFAAINLLSIILWTAANVLVGYFFGQALGAVKLWSNRAEIFLLGLFAFLAIFYLLRWLIFKKGKEFFLFIASLAGSIAEAVMGNAYIRKFITNHPRLIAGLAARLDKKSFYGRTFTLLVLAFTYVLALFWGVVEDVLRSETIVQIDSRLESLISAFRTPVFVKFFLWITALGEWQLIIVFAVGASLVFWAKKLGRYFIPFWLTLAGTEIFTFLGKLAVHRPRPAGSLFLETSYSFPSGHTTIAVAFFGFLAYIAWRESNDWRKRINAFFAAALLIILIGFSRIYLGVHYLSDIWAGLLLGGLWLIIGISTVEWLSFRGLPIFLSSPLDGRATRLFNAAVMAALAIFFILYGAAYQPAANPDRLDGKTAVVTADVLEKFSELKLSRYSEKIDGSPQEPLSFIISAENDAALTAAFRQSGWFAADPLNLNSLGKIAAAAVLNQSYDAAPMTPSFWQAEVNQFAFEKPTMAKSVRQRHHARFWRTNLKTGGGRNVYVGVASLDVGIKWWVAHQIDPDIDTERETVFTDLNRTGLIKRAEKKQFVPPVLGENQAGDQFFTDGDIYVIELK